MLKIHDHKVGLPEIERGVGSVRASGRGIRHLMFVIVQSQDVHRASRALNRAGLSVTELSSTGGFLGRRNTTLLIGLEENQEDLAIGLIQESCRQRIEYISTPLEGAPLPIPVATPVTVGGATLFSLAIERYEEI